MEKPPLLKQSDKNSFFAYRHGMESDIVQPEDELQEEQDEKVNPR